MKLQLPVPTLLIRDGITYPSRNGHHPCSTLLRQHLKGVTVQEKSKVEAQGAHLTQSQNRDSGDPTVLVTILVSQVTARHLMFLEIHSLSRHKSTITSYTSWFPIPAISSDVIVSEQLRQTETIRHRLQ